MNVTGMLPFEDRVHDYMIEHPDNHVLYRVTPEFTGDNLVADGVLMEAYSIEDKGALSFCVLCYNVQPYITIDYSTGDNHIADNYIHSENTETTTESWEDNPDWYSYVLNENSKKIHRPDCSAVADMNEENKTKTNRSYDELISEGYTPCKPGPLCRDGGKHDWCKEADHHSECRLSESGHVQSCNPVERHSLRNGGRLPVSGWRSENHPVSEYRGRVSGQQLEETTAAVFRLDGADYTA